MDFDKRIPVLIKVQSEIDFGNRSFNEPEIKRCDHCGANIFYVCDMYGLHKNTWGCFDDIKVVGETEESKKYRKWEVAITSEQRICAVCGISNGLISVWPDEEIAKELEDEYDKEMYEKALDLLKYPTSATQDGLRSYDHTIKEIKKAISEWEEKMEQTKKTPIVDKALEEALTKNSVEV